MKKLIYISGPLTKGGVLKNVKNAIAIGEELTKLDYLVFIPHLFYFWNKQHEHTWRYWMKIDLEWVKRCDGLYRIEGESRGANIEVCEANHFGIPVFYSIKELRNYFRRNKDAY